MEVFEDAGHLGSMSKRRALMDALNGFVDRAALVTASVPQSTER